MTFAFFLFKHEDWQFNLSKNLEGLAWLATCNLRFALRGTFYLDDWFDLASVYVEFTSYFAHFTEVFGGLLLTIHFYEIFF